MSSQPQSTLQKILQHHRWPARLLRLTSRSVAPLAVNHVALKRPPRRHARLLRPPRLLPHPFVQIAFKCIISLCIDRATSSQPTTHSRGLQLRCYAWLYSIPARSMLLGTTSRRRPGRCCLIKTLPPNASGPLSIETSAWRPCIIWIYPVSRMISSHLSMFSG